jgi:hypothetical protein
MKKIILIAFIITAVFETHSYSFFKGPVEKCMDAVEKKGGHVNYAAKICSGMTGEAWKCVRRVEKSGTYLYAAIKRCNK